MKADRRAGRGGSRRWVNLHDPDGGAYRLVTSQPSAGDPRVLVGRSYADPIAAHPFHPEPKSLGPDGAPCREGTVGLLARRPVVMSKKRHVGKEANELERVEAGLVDEIEEVLTVYERHSWEEFRERLQKMTVKEGMALTEYSRRQVYYLRSGDRKPSPSRVRLDAPGVTCHEALALVERDGSIHPPSS